MLTLKEYPVLFANCSFRDFKGRDLGPVEAFDPVAKTAVMGKNTMTNIQFSVDPAALQSVLAEYLELEEFFGTPVVEQLTEDLVGDEAENEIYDDEDSDYEHDEDPDDEMDDEDWDDDEDDDTD